MTIRTHEFMGWDRAELPVIAGTEPRGTVSLAALADPETHAQLLPLFITLAGGKRQGALTMIHYAVFALATVLISPFVYDGIALDILAEQLGMVLDESGDLTAIWVGQFTRIDPDHPTVSLGALSMRIITPIAELSRQAGRVSALAVTNITLDALSSACRRFENSARIHPEPGWIEEFIAACGHPEYQPGRPIYVQVDAGPMIEFRLPRTCCVLNPHPSEHACPTCPMHPDDATRVRIIMEWLNGLDDAGFKEVTGRARIVQNHENKGIEVPTSWTNLLIEISVKAGCHR